MIARQTMLPIATFFFLSALCAHTQEVTAYDRQNAGGIWIFSMGQINKSDFIAGDISRDAWTIGAQKDFVSGVSPRTCWSALCPNKRGEYKWAQLDRLFEIANTYDKFVNLMVIGGTAQYASPGWVWEVENINHLRVYNSGWGSRKRIPYLGDPAFTELWCQFITALGARYRNEPKLQRVSLCSGLDQEMYYIKDLTRKQLDDLLPGNMKQCIKDLKKHWHEVFLAYKAAFPESAFVLHLSNPILGARGAKGIEVCEDIVDDACRIFGNRLYLQQDGLRETNLTADEVLKSSKDSLRKIMLNKAEAGHLIGFETIVPPRMGQCSDERVLQRFTGHH